MISSSSPSSSNFSSDVESLRGKHQGNFFVRFFELDKHKADEWARSAGNINPYILATLRLLFFLNTMGAVAYSTYKSSKNLARFFFYLTNISAMSLMSYFGLMTFLTFRHARDRSHWGYFRRFILNGLHFTSWVLQVIIPPIYWFALGGITVKKDNWVEWWQDLSVHGLGLIFLVVELVLVRRWYACWRDAIVSVGTVLLYMFWMWLATAIFEEVDEQGKRGRWWPYDIYRFDHELAPVFYLGTFVLCVIVSLIVIVLHKLKNRLSQPNK